ncbi:APC family permease [Pseudomaricurvus alkylphenolicus]|uniref:APC family permease n=1 Tax=Pseudomaricurvus alkylphenolicus TaxID=1306991 RepID=UPI00142179F1|nr:APC family permease [Pseudomaricurvus alkylphenolicus]NIB38287.1 APC family permease [Pseudomaricurvus alkylphenolicus]
MKPSNHLNSNIPAARVLGLKSLIAVGVGLVVSQGIMALMLQGVGIAGIGFLLPMTLAFVIALANAASFSELALMFPKARGFSEYTEVALGHFPAMMGAYSGYVVVAMFAIPTELMLVDLLVGALYPGVFPPLVLGSGVLVLFTVLNIIGVDVFAKAQSVLAFTMILSLSVLGLSALAGEPSADATFANLFTQWNPSNVDLFALVTMAIWGFVGAEFVCPLTQECKSPERNIPRAMFLSTAIIFTVFIIYCLGALHYVPAEKLAGGPLPHVDYAKAVFGDSGLVFITIAGLTAVCSTVNTTLASVPRMLQGMARDRQALPQFMVLHPKSGTPWVAIVFMALLVGIPMALMSAEDISTMLISASLCWLLAYLIAHCSVLVLRKRLPEKSRPFKTPFYPMPQLIGIGGITYALLHAAPSPELVGQIYGNTGLVLGVVSVATLLWIKFAMNPGQLEVRHEH